MIDAGLAWDRVLAWRAIHRFLSSNDFSCVPVEVQDELLKSVDLSLRDVQRAYYTYCPLEKLTVAKLRKLASRFGIYEYAWKSKEDLIREIEEKKKERAESEASSEGGGAQGCAGP